MGDIIQLISLIKDTPTTITVIIVICALSFVMWMRLKDMDLRSLTTYNTIQNEKLVCLMTQNEQLLHSISSLQDQVLVLNNKLTEQSSVHQDKLDKTYKVIDEMRQRVMQLEDLVRKYQTSFDHCSRVNCKSRTV